MKRVTAFIVMFVMLTFITVPTYANESLELNVPSAILIEKTTGTVLYEKNADQKMRPASVTKIMTLLLIMESIRDGQYGYSDIVNVSAYATSMGGSQVYLKEGEKFTVDEMIKCIAVASANDCCVAMAEFTSGSTEAFVDRMNNRSKELGMTNTHFENCTGLDSDSHLTTARDISIMSRELLKFSDIKKYTGIWTDSIRDGSFGLTNTNKLIRFYAGATGLKTGYTSASGYCISATAQKENMELIAVVMAAKTVDERTKDAKTLLNFGFSGYELFEPKFPEFEPIKIIKGKKNSITPVTNGTANIVVKKGQSKNIKTETDLCSDILAPVEEGQKLGEVSVKIDDKILCKSDIISAEYVGKSSIWDIFFKILHYFLIV